VVLVASEGHTELERSIGTVPQADADEGDQATGTDDGRSDFDQEGHRAVSK
jgi:hypothetical protein